MALVRHPRRGNLRGMSESAPGSSVDLDTMIRVLICDDHALFRRGLVMVLESEPGIEVVAEAEDGEEAVRKCEDAAPDVVLMDAVSYTHLTLPTN